MASTKITGLTALNVRAIRETIPPDLGVTTTATTATFSMDAADARMLVEATIDRLPHRGHPRQSLHAVRRKLAKLAPEGYSRERMIVARNASLKGRAHVIDSEGRTRDAYTGEEIEL